MSIDKLADRRGFTLVEVLVALTLLTVVTVAFVPLFVYISEGSQANRARLVATKLAANIIEDIRALPYSQVGLAGGNPSGNIQPTTTVTVGGVNYTVQTRIWWVNDPADDSSGTDPIPYDYKRVRVSVSAPSVFTGEVVQTTEIHTLVSLEGEEEAFPGGNIRVQVLRGWRTTPGVDVPVENIRAELSAGPDAPQTNWTDEVGQVLFAVLDEGSYTVQVDPSDQGMMVHPAQAQQTAEVTSGVTVERLFEIEFPCHLEIELRDASTGNLINVPGTLVLETPETGTISKNFTAEMGGVLPKDFLGDLWPVGDGYLGTPYNLTVTADGYIPYVLLPKHEAVWDGTFDEPGQTKSLILELIRANASVTVTSQGSGMPVAGALVEIYRHTYTYHLGLWTGVCSSSPVASTQTTKDGLAGFVLEENNPCSPPLIPVEGYQYSRYCVKVTAPGYLPFGPEHGAFWVTGGQQWTDAGVVETYHVVLQPEFRSILVRAEKSNGKPKNIRVKVVGPNGYNQVQHTGADGEALFDNLDPGLYEVYRWFGGVWMDRREVNVVSGQYVVTYTNLPF
ncbi:type IV pilus modification PilV family protein [Desulforudis sp. 1088]|uniref:type IV pilus modification PilV family protein n=1 Tax=unclassified Candidatus Desulforudis TaxID=2635950 RepID=UPI003CE56E6A